MTDRVDEITEAEVAAFCRVILDRLGSVEPTDLKAIYLFKDSFFGDGEVVISFNEEWRAFLGHTYGY